MLGQAGICGGTGPGVRVENVNAANTSNTLEAVTNGAGARRSSRRARPPRRAFNGGVQINGDLTVTGTKSGFNIDDPRAPPRARSRTRRSRPTR